MGVAVLRPKKPIAARRTGILQSMFEVVVVVVKVAVVVWSDMKRRERDTQFSKSSFYTVPFPG